MSGIVALVGKRDQPIDEGMFANMLHLLQKRGPDNQAYWMEGRAALAHAALHTTHESKLEAQPSTLNGRVWLTADARIDDRKTLIGKLQAKGYSASLDNTDDELILLAYAAWDIEFLDHVIGDFAFCLWDQEKGQLFCATDQFGVVPFFYKKLVDGIIASNSLNCVRAHPEVSNDLNDQAICDYLLFRMNTNPTTTIFSNISKLPAGHCLLWKSGQLDIRRYWKPNNANYTRRSREEYLEEFERLLTAAVHDRLRANAAGTHLSGGMDSTSIAALVAQAQNQDGAPVEVRGYTQTSNITPNRLEAPFAQMVGEKLNMPVKLITQDDAIPLFQSDYDQTGTLPPEPSFIRTDIGKHYILNDASALSRTLFAGFGGDPLLDPQPQYQDVTGSRLQLLGMARDAWHHLHIHREAPRRIILNQNLFPNLGKRQAESAMAPDWLTESFISQENIGDRIADHSAASSSFIDRRRGMAEHALWRRIFDWHDPGFTGIATKVRFPFFDVRLVNWAQTIPPSPWFHRKYLLRQIMQGALPTEVLGRPKTISPGNPLQQRLQEPDTMLTLKSLLHTQELAKYVQAKALTEKMDNGTHWTNATLKTAMRVASLGVWMQRYKKHEFDPKKGNRSDTGYGQYVRRTG